MAEPYRNDGNDIHQRLDRTICTWDGEPYLVMTNGFDYPKIALHRIDNGRAVVKPTMIVDHTDTKFVDRSPPLGYMNFTGGAFYLVRTPTRTQNQGLRHGGVTSTCGILNIHGNWWASEPLYNAIKGVYPTVATAKNKLMMGEATGVAVHRHIALKLLDRRNMAMYVRERLTATWDHKNELWQYQTSPWSSVDRKTALSSGLF